MQNLKLLRVPTTPLWDVFTGEGWYNWTRILVRGLEIKVLAGNPLTSDLTTELTTRLKAYAKSPKQ